MTEMINTVVSTVVSYMQEFGMIYGMFVVILESIIPALPLGVFVAFNMMAYGTVVGFLISWIGTLLGCSLAYFLCNKIFSKYLIRKSENNPKLDKVIKAIKKIDIAKLVIIMALPLTPAFMINIAAGVTNMNYKKFLVSAMISKISIILFWGLIGKNVITNFMDIKSMILTLILVVLAYVISKVVSKKYRIE